MKRAVFFLVMLLTVLTFSVRAQVPVFFEDFEEFTIPTGWITIDGDGDGYFWEHSSVQNEFAGHESDGSVASFSYINEDGLSLAPDNWLISPTISLSGTSSLTYWFRIGDASYTEDHYGVYISTTTTDTSAFTLLHAETPTETNIYWTFRTIDLTNYAGQTVYIAFRHFNCSDMFAIALDDITVYSSPEGPTLYVAPDELNFGAIELNTSSVLTVDVLASNTTAISATVTAPFEISDDNVTFSNFAELPASGGTLYVRYAPTALGAHTGSISISSGTLSQTVTLNGKCVDCSAFTLPFSESFESLDDLGCWTIQNADSLSSNKITISNTYASEGTTSLRFSSFEDASDYNQYAITPELPVSATKMVSFDYQTSGNGLEMFRVGYSTTTNDISAFTWYAPVSTAINEWAEYLLPDIPGEAKYIAINYFSDFLYYLYIDNFVATEAPACGAPTGLTTVSPGDTVFLSWANANVDHWEVAYGPTGFNIESDSAIIIHNINEHTVPIAGLTNGVTYDFYVRAICEDEESNWAGPISTAPHLYAMGVSGSANITGCNITITDNGGLSGNYADYCDYTLTIYPESVGTLVSLSGTYIGEGMGYTVVYDYMNIYNGTSADEAELLGQVYSTTDGEEITFGPFTSETGPLTILFHSDYMDNYAGFVATATCVEAPSCYKPSGLTVSNVSHDAATVSWSFLSENPDGFNVVLSESPITDPDSISTMLTTPTTSINLTDLTPSTTYYFMVQTDCGDIESEWSSMLTFTTTCTPIDTIPYAEDFDTYSAGYDSYPECWFKINTASGDRPYIIDNGYNSSAGSLYFWASPNAYNIAIMPMLDNSIALNTLQASFMYKATYISNYMIVGVMNSPTDTASFVPVDTVYPGNPISYWVKREVNFNEYTGTGRYIAFKNEYHDDYGYGYIDDLVIRPIPDCQTPTQLTVTGVTTSSISLDWVETGHATAWEIVYGEPGFNPDSTNFVLTDHKPFTLGNLNASTTYQIYLRAGCSESEHSEWCSPVTITTECAPMDIPYTENFNGYAASSGTYPLSSYPNDPMPLCWTFLNRSTSSSYFPTAFLTSNFSYAASGNCLLFASSSSTPLYAVLPAFNENLNTLQIQFTYRNEGLTPNNGILSLGYLTNPADASSFVEIATYPRTSVKTEVTEFLDSIPASITGAHLAFKYTGGSGSDYYLGIDNITVERIPTCLPPTELMATGSTSNAVALDWMAGADETSWNITYGPVGFTPGSNAGMNILTNDNFYYLSDLQPSATYDFYVRAICGEGDTSSWTGPATATTNSILMPANGATTVTTCSLTVYDDGGSTGNYSTNSMSMLTIEPEISNHVISISGTLDTEGGYDSLYVYDGMDLDAPLLGAFTGHGVNINLTATSGPLTLFFVSDYNQTYSGFELTVTCVEGSVPAEASVTTDSASAITQTTATLYATITNPDDLFLFDMGFEWQVSGTTNIHYADGIAWGENTFTANLTDLEPNTTYTYRAFIQYDMLPVYGETRTFTTAAQEVVIEPCDTPTGLDTTEVENHTITVVWDNNEEVDSWNVQYRTDGGEWTTVTANTNSYTLFGLEGLTTYEIRVQADCGDTLSEWSDAITVQTKNVGIVSWLENSVTLFPNPAQEFVNVECRMMNVEYSVTDIQLYDVFGKLIWTDDHSSTPTRINISGLADGMYFVRVTTDKGAVTKTFVKK